MPFFAQTPQNSLTKSQKHETTSITARNHKTDVFIGCNTVRIIPQIFTQFHENSTKRFNRRIKMNGVKGAHGWAIIKCITCIG